MNRISLTALLIFVTSTLGAKFCYDKLDLIENPNFGLIDKIKSGSSSYILKTEGKAVGKLELDLSLGIVRILTSKLKLSVEDKSKDISEIFIDSKIFSNALGQVFSSSNQILVDNQLWATLNTKGINEITAEVTTYSNGSQITKTTPLIGPIRMIINSDNTTRVKHPNSQGILPLLNFLQKLQAEQILNEIKIEEKLSGAIDISGISKKYTSLESFLKITLGAYDRNQQSS